MNLSRVRFRIFIVGLITAFSLLIGYSIPLNATITDSEERRKIETPMENGWHGINFDLTTKDWALPSSLIASKGNFQNAENLICKSLDDLTCLQPGWQMKVRALFDLCEGPADRDCIASLVAIRPNGERLEAKQKLVLESKHTFAGDKTKWIPDGTGAGIWTIQDGANEVNFAVVAGIEMRIKNLDPNLTADVNTNISREKMLMSIQPIELVQSSQTKEVEIALENGTPVWNTSAIIDGCFVAANGLCALKKAFSDDLSFELTVRFRKGVPGWMVGRIQNFKLVGTQFPANDGFEMKVSGRPVIIGSVHAWSRWENTSEEVRDLYAKGVDGYSWRPNQSPEMLNPDGNTRTLLTYVNESGARGLAHFNAWLPLIKDKATSMRTRWNVQTVMEKNDAFDKCSENLGLIGIVNSNATVYSAGPPSFNRKEGTLEYQVAAPHYRSDGKTKHLGTYDLAMRADVARCLYGFTKAPISAIVIIESESGTTAIATKTVTERDGLLRLNASGFSFSSPRIKVKLTQGSIKLKTITCKKGKKKISITGLKPSCPKGYV